MLVHNGNGTGKVIEDIIPPEEVRFGDGIEGNNHIGNDNKYNGI